MKAINKNTGLPIVQRSATRTSWGTVILAADSFRRNADGTLYADEDDFDEVESEMDYDDVWVDDDGNVCSEADIELVEDTQEGQAR